MTDPTKDLKTHLTIADLTPARGLTDHFDELVKRLCDTSTVDSIHPDPNAPEANGSGADAIIRFCHHLRHVSNADTAYLCNRTTLDIVASSSMSRSNQHCADTDMLHNALISMISDLWNCTAALRTPDIRVYPDEPQFSFIILPLAEDTERLMILVNADISDSCLSHYLTHAVSVIYSLFQTRTDHSKPLCQATVFDALHSCYQNSSDEVAELRLELFARQLKDTRLSLDGLFQSPADNDLLNPLKATLPEAIYDTAALWGPQFKTQADLHFLIEASHAYKTLCETNHFHKFSATRALEIKVHACSLSDSMYINSLRELLERCVLHGSRTLFTVFGQAHMSDDLSALIKEFNLPDPCISDATEKKPRAPFSIAEEFDVLTINNGTVDPAGNNRKATS